MATSIDSIPTILTINSVVPLTTLDNTLAGHVGGKLNPNPDLLVSVAQRKCPRTNWQPISADGVEFTFWRQV